MGQPTSPLPQDPAWPLWGELRPGNYGVGFESFIMCDYSRRYRYPSETGPEAHTIPRPLALHVWYPINSDNQPVPNETAPTPSPFMPYGDYLSFEINDPSLKPFVQQLNQFILETVCSNEMEKCLADLTPEERQQFQRLLKLPTACIANAPKPKSKFPLLLYHQGLGESIADNPALLEFFASHGYVVVTSAFQPAHGLFFGVNYDLDRSLRDIACILQKICQDYPVNLDQVALMGHSYGASAVQAFAYEACSEIKAVVSLDSCREWDSDDDEFSSEFAKRVLATERFTTPLLISTKTTPTNSFKLYSKLIYSERYYLTVKHLDHNDFVTLGLRAHTVFAKECPQPNHGAAKVVCECALAFLEHHLATEKTEQTQLVETFQAIDHDAQCLSIQTEPAATPPMKEEQLLAIFLAEDSDQWQPQLPQLLAGLEPKTIMNLGYGLRLRRRYEQAICLYQYLNQQVPSFSPAYEALGDVYNYSLQEYDEAIAAYEIELEKLPDDPTLTPETKRNRQKYITEDLEHARKHKQLQEAE